MSISGGRIADGFEVGAMFVAFAAHAAGEAAISRARTRREILEHNARVATVRAARAHRRAAAEKRRRTEDALGQRLMSKYLDDRLIFD